MAKRHSLPEILFGDSIIPRYVPFYYRLYLLLCKFYRSSRRRLFPGGAKRGVIPDENLPGRVTTVTLGNKKEPFINKTFSAIDNDLERQDIKEIARSIRALKNVLEIEGFRFTTPAGNFKAKDAIPEKERNKLWENVWVIANSGVSARDVILDIGGASSIFSFFLADLGCETHVIDNDWGNHGIIYNARFVNQRMNWKMKAQRRDISRGLPFGNDTFDRVFCVCVLEHLGSSARRKTMGEIKRVLKPGGIAGFTFDYDRERNTPGLDRGIRYSFRDRLFGDVIRPSGLGVYGNETLLDDCPPDFFLGSLFLRKSGSRVA